MASKNPYSPLIVPQEWQGTMRNFGVKLAQIITDIYLRLTRHGDAIDQSAAETAIIVNGNTASERIAKNAYVLVRNSTIENRPDGLYKSGAVIEADTAITASSLSARTIGGELKSLMDTAANVPTAVIKDSVAGGGSGTFTLPSDGVYLLTGFGSVGTINSVVFLIGGYVTASRCTVTNLTAQTGITIDSSNTTELKFGISNTTSTRLNFAIYKFI